MLITAAYFSLFPAPVVAYDETGTRRTCIACHGREEGAPGSVVSGTRQGPHGGYTTGTQKCQTCHTPHGAGYSNGFTILLMEAANSVYGPTISDTCLTCHDGTGGTGVYGAIRARTGVDPADPNAPASAHRVDRGTGGAMRVPGGASDGSTATVTFTGYDGGLSCADCHSPHNSLTVEPFVGDRLRILNDTSTAQPTNRLLKQRPGTSVDTTPVAVYGTDWCVSCHRGRHSQGNLAGNHPVAPDASGWNYGRVERLNAAGTARDAEPGPLGGSNRGYLMPVPYGAQLQPICQQCHEDARAVGNVTQFQLSAAEQFNPTLDGVDPSAVGNPRFQNFPHETFGRKFLIEEPAELCTNCHPANPMVNP